MCEKRIALITIIQFVILLCAATGLALAQDVPAGGSASQPPAEVTTEESAEEIAEEDKPAPVTNIPCPDGEYICGKGFTWKTEDGDFGIRIGGRFQFHWILDNYDIHRAPRPENNSEFGVPRAYIFVSGNTFKEFKYSLSYRIDNGLFDDWKLTWIPKEYGKNFELSMGKFKPGFSREYLTSTGGLSLVNKSLADSEFHLNRDYGLNFRGKLLQGKFKADLGFFNGLADSSTDNTGYMTCLRLQYDVNKPPASQGDLKKSKKPGLSLGFAYSMENDVYDFDGNGIYDDNTSRLTFDWSFYWQGLNIIAAYFARTEENYKTAGPGDPFEKNRNSAGYSLQGSYFILPGKLDIVALMSYVEPDIKDPRARKFTTSGWKHETRLGFGYYVKGHNLKLQGDIGVIRERRTHGSLDDGQIRLQLTVCF